MKKDIKTQLREYLDLKLKLCGKYMNEEQDFDAAKAVLHQAVGAVEFTAMSLLGTDASLATDIEDMCLTCYRGEFYRTLFPEIYGVGV